MMVNVPVEVLHENCINCPEFEIESVTIEACAISGMKGIIHDYMRCINLHKCQRLMGYLKDNSLNEHG